MKISLWIVFIGIIIALIIFFRFYNAILSPSVSIEGDDDSKIIYIHTGASFNDVKNILFSDELLSDSSGFNWLAKKKKYPSNIKPGRYRISDNMSNNELINLLRSGRQEPFMLTFNNVRTLTELAGIVSKSLEPDSNDFQTYFYHQDTPEKYGFTSESFPSMFIPNSYEFYWTTSPEEFTQRMKREYVAFWSGNRDQKAKAIGFTKVQISTLASIVDQETLHDDENERIAGVFINRLKRGIPDRKSVV